MGKVSFFSTRGTFLLPEAILDTLISHLASFHSLWHMKLRFLQFPAFRNLSFRFTAHGAIGEMTPTKRSIKNDHMGTSGMTPEKFWYQNFFPHPGLPLNKILKNCWRAPWPARRPEILHAGHWPQYATFIFYTNFCAKKFLLTRF